MGLIRSKKGEDHPTLKKLAYVGTIIMAIIALIHFWPEVRPWLEKLELLQPKEDVQTEHIEYPYKEEEFDYSKVSIIDLKPVVPFFYINSTQMVCYSLNNPIPNTNDTFSLIGEWFVGGKEIPEEPRYEDTEYFRNISPSRTWMNWHFFDSIKNNKTKFRVVLEYDNKKPIVNEITLNVTKSQELEPFLQNEKEGVIKWDDDMIKEFIKTRKEPICNLDSAYLLAESLFKSTKEFMITPPRTPDILRYDIEEINALDSFNEKEGTSSEFSVVYAALLRIFGIPSKIVFNKINNKTYYFTEVYIENEGWVVADVYNEDAKFDDCINLSTGLLEKDVQYNGICLPSLSPYVEFKDIKIWKYLSRWFRMEGVLKSKINEDLDYYSLKINVTFYNSSMEEIFSYSTYLLTSETIGNETIHNFSLNLFSEEPVDFKYAKVDVDEFYSR